MRMTRSASSPAGMIVSRDVEHAVHDEAHHLLALRHAVCSAWRARDVGRDVDVADQWRARPVRWKANAITSVGPRRPRWSAIERAIARAETNAIEMRASRTRSAASTCRRRGAHARRGMGSAPAGGHRNGERHPASGRRCGERASRRRRRRELGRHTAGGRGVVDAVVVHADEDAGELLLDHLELLERQRRLAELAPARCAGARCGR